LEKEYCDRRDRFWYKVYGNREIESCGICIVKVCDWIQNIISKGQKVILSGDSVVGPIQRKSIPIL